MSGTDKRTSGDAAGHRRAWKLKRQTLHFGQQPAIMGIVNVTPDSFSDGGQYFDPHRAVDHALQLADEGADILDIGGESTRPYSEAVSASEELDRILPVIETVARQCPVPISVDTSKSSVARQAIAAGAEIINDVTALTGDPAMVDVAIQSAAGVCLMHMQGTPQTMQDDPCYDDVVAEVRDYLADRIAALRDAGIAAERICVDPGIGFGKTHLHNVQLIRQVAEFHRLGCPVLVGHSRKGFIGKLTNDTSAERIAGTLAVSLFLATQRVNVVRVHDVRLTRQAFDMQRALSGES